MVAQVDLLLVLIRRSNSANSSGGNSSGVPSAVAFGRSWWPQISQSFTKPVEVIAQAGGFSSFIEVRCGPGNPRFLR
jgi:hypothetical protein